MGWAMHWISKFHFSTCRFVEKREREREREREKKSFKNIIRIYITYGKPINKLNGDTTILKENFLGLSLSLYIYKFMIRVLPSKEREFSM